MLGILFAALVLLAWGGVVFGSFQYDDFPNILTHPATAAGGGFLDRVATGIRPLTRLTYALDYALWSRWAGGWLLTNLLLHLATSLAVWRLARLRSGTPFVAALAAVVFAGQPAHAMTVAYVSGRSSGLMTALLAASLVAYERYTQDVTASRWRYLAVASVLFLLACAAKEVALVFPLLLVLWESTRADRQPRLRDIGLRVGPFFAMALLCCALVLATPRYRELLTFSLNLRTPLQSLAHNAAALPMTLALFARPWALAVEHVAPIGRAGALIGMLVIAAWAAVAIGVRRRVPVLTLGMLWPVLALLPTHSVIAKVDAVSESTLYLAWIGPSLAIAFGIGHWFGEERAGRGWRRAILVLAVLAMAATCVWRTAVWGDPIRLWREAVNEVPQSSRAWNNLGLAYLEKGRRQEAKHAFEQALRTDPGNTKVLFNLDLLELVH